MTARKFIFSFFAVTLLAGCASSTIESRREERFGAYTGLSEEHRQLVDAGEIRVGMSPDAVYIAWGKAAQVLRAGDSTGESTTWLYEGTAHDTVYGWRYYEIKRKDGTTELRREIDRDTNFKSYVSAELVFKNGRLERWKMLPRPSERTYFAH